jgi:hypothetical protein
VCIEEGHDTTKTSAEQIGAKKNKVFQEAKEYLATEHSEKASFQLLSNIQN